MRRRSGFTLVEVLVAMALILFMLVILAASFGSAMQSVGDFKAAADLAERLRLAATLCKRDLQADHFTDGPQNGPRMSDPSFWNRLSDPINSPPAGFFRIYQGAPDVLEGADLDGIPSYYQTTTALHYTMALRGVRRSDFLSAAVPAGSPLLSNADPLLGPTDARYQDTANVYSSQFAEAVVFLAPTGDVTDSSPGPALPLFGLYHRQFLTVPAGWTAAIPVAQAPNYLEVSVIPAANEGVLPVNPNLTFNSVGDLSMPTRRYWMYPFTASGIFNAGGNYQTMGQSNPGFQAADLIMSDVVSFDVRVLIGGDTEFRDLFDPAVQAYSGGNPSFTGAGNPRVFDTWSNRSDAGLTGADFSNWDGPWRSPAQAPTGSTIPLYKNAAGQPIVVRAIQISLRVWDFKTKKTRAVTVVQQM